MDTLQETFAVRLLIMGLIAFFIIKFFKRKEKKSHTWRRKSAKKALRAIQKIQNDAQIFAYLRKVDHFVFEEMILKSIEKQEGAKVLLSQKYTGDGGADGTFFLTRGNIRLKVIVQAKRYKGYISKKDIEKFGEDIVKLNADYGIFVHTGKTGKGIKQMDLEAKNIEIFSGEKMLKLLLNRL